MVDPYRPSPYWSVDPGLGSYRSVDRPRRIMAQPQGTTVCLRKSISRLKIWT